MDFLFCCFFHAVAADTSRWTPKSTRRQNTEKGHTDIHTHTQDNCNPHHMHACHGLTTFHRRLVEPRGQRSIAQLDIQGKLVVEQDDEMPHPLTLLSAVSAPYLEPTCTVMILLLFFVHDA